MAGMHRTDYGLPEQFRYALSGRGGGCGAHDSSGSVLFSQQLRLRFSVRRETCLLTVRPGGSLLRAADVPIGTAALQHGAQIEAQFLHRRPAEEPVAVVDLVDTQAR